MFALQLKHFWTIVDKEECGSISTVVDYFPITLAKICISHVIFLVLFGPRLVVKTQMLQQLDASSVGSTLVLRLPNEKQKSLI